MGYDKLILQQILPADGALVSPSDTVDLTKVSSLFVGTGGNIKVDMVSGATLTFYNIPDGCFLPIKVKRVYLTGTTASNILRLN